MVVLKNVLVGTDFGEPASVALAYGRDLCRQYGAVLHLLFVVDDQTARYANVEPVITVEDQREIERAAETRLNALLTDEDLAQLNARAIVRSSLSPAQAIGDYARANAIDLIIVGTQGRGGVAHLLMGSVAERVVRIAPCPVLTVRYPERDFIAPDALTTVTGA
jgi:nucleotide-binding universal stress UspA family protein